MKFAPLFIIFRRLIGRHYCFLGPAIVQDRFEQGVVVCPHQQAFYLKEGRLFEALEKLQAAAHLFITTSNRLAIGEELR